MIVIDVETTGLERDSDVTGGVLVTEELATSIPGSLLLDVYEDVIVTGMVVVSHTNFDVHVLRHHTGCTPSERLDTQVMAKCYDPSLLSYKLDTLCQKWLGIGKDTKPETWTEWDEKTATYCLQDGLITQQLAKFLIKQDLGNYWSVEQPFHKVIDEMEWKGIEVNQEYILSVLSELEVEYNTKLQELHNLVGIVPTSIATSTLEPKEKVYSKGVYKRLGVLYGTHVEVGTLNPASNNQVLWVLKHRYGVDLDTLDKTETGLYSTSNLPKDIPITPILSELSRITKLADYLKNVVNRVTSNNTVHSSFQQIGAVTGRMSSSSPNLQNPANDERVRKSFSVKDGYTQVGWDLSNIEGRLLAEAIYRETGDRTMLDTFISGKDFHLENAKNWGLVELFGDEKLARQRAKAIFACVPMDTQALTPEGWKYRRELNVGDLILAYNPETDRNEWTPILRIVDNPNQDIIEWKLPYDTNTIRSTPDHRWFGYKRVDKGRKGRWNVPMFFTTAEVTTEHCILQSAKGPSGAGVSHGFMDKKYQDHNWEEYVLSMTEAERWVFFNACIATDGHVKRHKCSNAYNMTQQMARQPGLLAGFRLCAYLLGYTVSTSYRNAEYKDTNYTMGVVNVTSRRHFTGQKLNPKYAGKEDTWCVTTKFGTWVMKQGDVITITGNCVYGGGVKAIAEYAKAPLEVGQVIYDSLEKNFPSFFSTRDSIVKRAEENGGVIYSMFGRKLFYPEYVPSLLTKKARAVMGPEDNLHQVKKQLLARANRQVFNAYIQGSAADIIKIINNKLYQYGYCPNAIVHDEDQTQLPTEQVEDYIAVVSRVFEEFNRESNLEVPITYEIKTGRNWAETH